MSMKLRNTISTTAPSIQNRDGNYCAHSRQRGITLMMSLVFLLLLTILGVTSINISTLQEKMSGNLRDQDVAYQAAESALRYGELMVNNMWLTGKPTPISKNICPSGTPDCAWDTGLTNPLDDIWWGINRQAYGGSGKDLPETTADPAYIVEHLANVEDSGHRGDKYAAPPGTQFYRITARAQGSTPFAESILESTYKIQHKN